MNGFQKLCFLLIILVILLAKQTEGLKAKTRIVSGYSAKPAQFPWQAILRKTRRGALHGAGSIISKNWVLTAAHCIHNLKSIFVVFGTIYLRDMNALTIFANDLYPHPQYNASSFNNDIGLIKLKRQLVYNSFIKPIALVTSDDQENDFVGARGIITGFGYIHDEVPNPMGDLLQAPVIIIANEECESAYEDHIIESSMCSLGYDSNQSICEGDSGGPLITRDQYDNPMQIGIISFSAEDTCDMNHPSAFARLSSFLDFITETTNMTMSQIET